MTMTVDDQRELTNKDVPRYRIKEYEEGGAYKIECRDPFGFWYIIPMKGPVPEILSGTYTSIIQAERALDNYIQQRDTVDGERRTFSLNDDRPPRT